MWPATAPQYYHPFQKHVCILFLSFALLASYLSLSKRDKYRDHFIQYNSTVNNNTIELFLPSSTPLKNSEIVNANRVIKNTTIHPNTHVIHILGLFELTTKWGVRADGYSELSAAQLAVDDVNSRNIVPGYILKLLINDTKCDAGVGIDTFFHSIYSNETITMLLGTSCSNVTESLAYIVSYWNILQISFGSKSPALSDRHKFPLFFRTVAPDSSHNTAKIRFVKHCKWNVVATFSQSENRFLLPLNELVTDLEKANVSCAATITFSLDNYKDQLKVLKAFDIRIIIGSFSAGLAPKIFCEVYELKMFGADYVWILQDQQTDWWHNINNSSTTSDCISSKLSKSIEGVILVGDFNNRVSENQTSISGLSNELFETKMSTLNNQKVSKYAKFAYDAIWAMALTLRDTQSVYRYDQLKHFTYKRNDMVCNFVKKMSSLSFIGVSGPIKFAGADRIGNSVLQQLQDGILRPIAIFNSNSNKLDFACNLCSHPKWQTSGGRIPIAQRILKLSLITIPAEVFYTIFAVSILGIAASLVFLYFNLHFRRVKSVKLSSPKLNNVAVIGCMLVYLSVVLLGFVKITLKSNKYFDELCSIRVYLLSAGISLAFGSMFAKTYRVHRIFTYCGGTGKVKDKLLKDKQLIGIILIPLVIDAIILTLWIRIDPMVRQLHNLTLEINSEDRGVVYQQQVEICRSQNTSGWIIALYGYKCLILIMGIYMAWETRHVKVQALNDSQYIGICVYSTVFSAIIVVLSNLISEHVILSYLARTISILASTTITLFLLFLPKFRSVYQQHNTVGGTHQQDPIMQSMGLKIECNTRRLAGDDPRRELIHRLEIQNRVLRCELKSLDEEIEQLERRLLIQSSSLPSSSSSSSSKNKIEIYAITKRTNDLSTSGGPTRASWPSDNTSSNNNQFIQIKSQSQFGCSDNRLSVSDKFNLFGKLKWIFRTSNMSSVDMKNEFENNCSRAPEPQSSIFINKPHSNPEFDRNNCVAIKENNRCLLMMMKARSEMNLMDNTCDYNNDGNND